MAGEPVLRLLEDALTDGAAYSLPALNRFLYVAHGSAALGERRLGADQGLIESGAIVGRAGPEGATIWRWQLQPAGIGADEIGVGWRCVEKLSAALTTLPQEPLLMRGDSVAFPAGGCALRHVHQGPGIRCLIEGGMRIDTHGRSTAYAPGGAWFEAGPEPVFAQAADRPTRFIRCMVLPARLFGQSSIRYVDQADRDKPKDQSYRSYGETAISL